MKTTSLYIIIISMLFCIGAKAANVSSPDNRLQVNVDIKNNKAVYSVSYDNTMVLKDSPLGFCSNEGDFIAVEKMAEKISNYKDSYTLDRCKTDKVDYEANVLTYKVKNKEGQQIDIVFYVSNNDIAFRYELPRIKDRGSIRIMNEETGFRFPDGTTTFLCPQSTAMIGWKRSKPSYEEEYHYDAPMTERSLFGKGYTFPGLFKVTAADRTSPFWVLISETGTDSHYCGCRLSDCKEGNLYTVEFAMPEENNGNGTIEPAFALPGVTPWRTITVGASLKPIVETTAPWNTVSPLIKGKKTFNYGKSTWSWIVWQDNSMNWDDQITFINLAQQLGYPYILIDAGWDQAIGYEKMEEMVKIAQGKGVDVFLWWSSSGYWNDIVQSPINRMDNSIVRKEMMRWMKKIGVKGIKVDFWAGDKQETMRMYEEVLSDAYDNDLMVIFHGCTLPRGWERMYPNYVGSEAVLASENLIFSQHFCDEEARNTATHPFIRNTVGCMEWGGSFLNTRMGKDNKHGNTRRTTFTHELAQAVLFQNPIQNFAVTPENLKPLEEGGAPEMAVEFMKTVPTTWNKTIFIDGYPGKYAVLAREHEGAWYIAGNNAEKDTKDMVLDLSEIISKGKTVTLYYDNAKRDIEKKEIKISNPRKVKISVPSGGGFVIKD